MAKNKRAAETATPPVNRDEAETYPYNITNYTNRCYTTTRSQLEEIS